MIISSILNREKLSISDSIKILWTKSSTEFENFIISKAGCELITLNQLYYGNSIPHLIICNDKVQYRDICYNVSRQLHLPVLLVDHNIKNPLYDNEKIQALNLFPCCHHIAISKTVADSWNLKDAQILSYNTNDKENINIWKNLIFQTAKKLFKM